MECAKVAFMGHFVPTETIAMVGKAKGVIQPYCAGGGGELRLNSLKKYRKKSTFFEVY